MGQYKCKKCDILHVADDLVHLQLICSCQAKKFDQIILKIEIFVGKIKISKLHINSNNSAFQNYCSSNTMKMMKIPTSYPWHLFYKVNIR